MTSEKHQRILEQGVEAWNAWRREHSFETPQLEEANLEGANLVGARLEEAQFIKANLNKANLKGARLGGAYPRVKEQNPRLLPIIQMTRLYRASLRDANLEKAYLSGTDFRNADLRGANLSQSCLTGANLTGANVDEDTKLERADVRGCIIDRHTIESLKAYGGLTTGARMNMTIRDDVADLRLLFSGVRLWFHLFAMAAFLAPYLFFIFHRYLEARFFDQPHGETIPLWIAIGRYIWNGGQNWQAEWDFHWSFITFVLLCAYNTCRWLLLAKTIELEHRQEISGLPVPFTLEREPRWKFLMDAMNWLFWAGLLFLVISTGHFLTQEIPVAVLG